ncbi:MAG: hypothetical protein DMF58_17470 [Acidobacteria bacterium]|nr:MAG: hypothetical protein DMF58_17470 [Acidobacteriota bacterium]
MGRKAAGDRREPLCRLVRFEATDGVPVAGLLYDVAPPLRRRKPAGEPALHAIIWLHGTGGASIFESARTNLLARVFLDHRIAFFPFNNRGAQYVRRAGRRYGGRASCSVVDFERSRWRATPPAQTKSRFTITTRNVIESSATFWSLAPTTPAWSTRNSDRAAFGRCLKKRARCRAAN